MTQTIEYAERTSYCYDCDEVSFFVYSPEFDEFVCEICA